MPLMSNIVVSYKHNDQLTYVLIFELSKDRSSKIVLPGYLKAEHLPTFCLQYIRMKLIEFSIILTKHSTYRIGGILDFSCPKKFNR